MRNITVAVFLTLLPFHTAMPNAYAEAGNPIAIKSTEINTLLPTSPKQKTFGKLEFLGGLILSATDKSFGGFSGLRFQSTSQFMAITDKGKWLQSELIREGNKPIALKNSRMGRLRDANGEKLNRKTVSDAEGLELVEDQYLVSFERNHRVERFSFTKKQKLKASTPEPLIELIDVGLKRNNGPEGIALAPATSPLRGSILILPEHAFNLAGHLRIFVFKDGKRDEFALKSSLGFSLTDAAFHPNGDLYILERKYSLFTGLAVSIRRLEANSLKLGETLQGEELINIDGSHEVDNMEGIAVSAQEDGSTLITLISDDNFSNDQRTLLLEFSFKQ